MVIIIIVLSGDDVNRYLIFFSLVIITAAYCQCLEVNGCSTIFINPGSPGENGYIESFIDKLRDECLKQSADIYSLVCWWSSERLVLAAQRNFLDKEVYHEGNGHKEQGKQKYLGECGAQGLPQCL